MTNIPAYYTISYICQEGNRVEVDDDEKTLSELNIKLPFIKMNKHVTNRRNTDTQKNIGIISTINNDLTKINSRIPNWTKTVRLRESWKCRGK